MKNIQGFLSVSIVFCCIFAFQSVSAEQGLSIALSPTGGIFECSDGWGKIVFHESGPEWMGGYYTGTYTGTRGRITIVMKHFNESTGYTLWEGTWVEEQIKRGGPLEIRAHEYYSFEGTYSTQGLGGGYPPSSGTFKCTWVSDLTGNTKKIW